MSWLHPGLQVQAAEALKGLEHGAGPWWDGRSLGGAPLFGALEAPFSSPATALLIQAPLLWTALHGTLLAAGLTLLLAHPRSTGLPPRPAALLAVMATAALGTGEAAPLLPAWCWGVWAVLMLWVAPRLAAPFCALAAAAGSPLLLFAAAAASARMARARDWAWAWGLGLGLAAPVVLETLRQMPGTGAAHPEGWPLGWLCSPLLFHQFSALLLGVALLPWLGRGRSVAVLAGAFLLAGLSPVLHGGWAPQTLDGAPDLLRLGGARLLAARPALPPEPQGRVLGPLAPLGPRGALARWRELGARPLEREDGLSLANIGWIQGLPGDGRWRRGVDAAVVDGAASLEEGLKFQGRALFQRPLLLVQAPEGRPLGTAWRLQPPERPAPGLLRLELNQVLDQSWAFFSENHAPGWTAQVEGRQARREWPWRTEGGWMAVPLRNGDTTVRLTYEPPNWPTGLWLAGLAFFGLARRLRRPFGH